MNISNITQEIESLKDKVSFPVTKQELLSVAEGEQVSGEAKQILGKLPEGTFNSIEEVVQKLPFGQEVEGDIENKVEGML